MRNVTIVESNVEPNKEHLWFYNGKLKWFGPNGWEEINSQVMSPTTTPKPVVITTTTTSTPVPTTTTTTSTPGPTTTTTTSTAPATFKLTNDTGETLTINAMGWVEGEVTTIYPVFPHGVSAIVLRSSEYVELLAPSYYNLSIIVDGDNRGELASESPGSNIYKIPQAIFSNATEVIVYNASVTTTTSTVKPNVK